MHDQFDLHVFKHFLDDRQCARLVDEIRRAETSAALTYGKDDSGIVENRIRKVRSARLERETIEWVTAKLCEYSPRMQAHFGVPAGEWEEPQFLWYQPGDFFVAHQDGNTGLLQLESDRLRRVSVTLFLNRQSEDEEPEAHCGGSLVFRNRLTGDRFTVRSETGKLIAFRSELTHEVTPVTHGDRFVIVTWYRIVS